MARAGARSRATRDGPENRFAGRFGRAVIDGHVPRPVEASRPHTDPRVLSRSPIASCDRPCGGGPAGDGWAHFKFVMAGPKGALRDGWVHSGRLGAFQVCRRQRRRHKVARGRGARVRGSRPTAMAGLGRRARALRRAHRWARMFDGRRACSRHSAARCS